MQYEIPVTTMTSKTAKAMLPPSYHPSAKPYQLQIKGRINFRERWLCQFIENTQQIYSTNMNNHKGQYQAPCINRHINRTEGSQNKTQRVNC